MRFPNLTPAEIRKASAALKAAGLALPKHGWSLEVPFPEGKRRLARDNKGYYWTSC